MKSKTLFNIIGAFLLTGLLFACQDESLISSAGGGETITLPNGKLRVPMLLSTPQMGNVHISTRATVDKNSEESTINSIWVAVFEAGDPNTVLPTDRLVELQQGAVNSESVGVIAHATVDLLPYNSPCRLHVIANPNQTTLAELGTLLTVDQASAQGGTASSIADLNTLEISLAELYKLETPADKPGGSTDNLNPPFPMCSELLYLPEISISSTTNLQMDMDFSFARIDVNAAPVNTYFTILGANLLNGAQTADMFETSLPINSGGTIRYTETPVNPLMPDTVSPIYLFPNRGALEGQAQGTNPTELIIHGKYTSPNNIIHNGYYKIQIHYNQNGSETYDIRHNTLYTIQLDSVKGPGYATEAEAIANSPHNIDYTTEVTDSNSRDIVIANGEYYLGVSNSEYILFGNEATGIPVVTLTHNAPGSVSTRTATITGDGMSLFDPANPGSTTTKQLTLPAGSGEQSQEIRINMGASATTGTLSIRIGNLLKEVKVTRKAFTEGSTSATIAAADFGGSDFEWMQSESDRIAIGSGNSLVVTPQASATRSNRVLSTVRAFDKESRGSVIIAVKRAAREVVYYEKYADNTVGIFFQPLANLQSDMPDTKEIIEAGYGILDTERKNTITVNIGSSNYANTVEFVITTGFSDYAGSLYRANQRNMAIAFPGNGTWTTLLVKKDGISTGQYIIPNYAKGVYGVSSITHQNKDTFLIRTPRQFRNIDMISGTSGITEAFRQEMNLDFSKAADLGGGTFEQSIIKPGYSFNGYYDGGGKEISRVDITSTTSKIGIFSSMRYGTIKNITLVNSTIVAPASNGTAAIVGYISPTGNVEIDHISLKNVTVNSSRANSDYNNVDTGGIIGLISGGGSSSNITISNCETDAGCTITGQGSYVYSGTAGILGTADSFSGELVIADCTNWATVGISTPDYGVASGIVGEIYDQGKVTITHCKNYGAVSAAQGGTTSYSRASVGGIVAHVQGQYGSYSRVIQDCENHGTIDGFNQAAGGIIGHVDATGWTIDNCTNQGEVKSIANATSGDYRYSGGIIGYQISGNPTIKNCTNLAAINGDKSAGGIAGYANYTTITGCQNTNTVTGKSAGGIVGSFSSGSTVENSQNAGAINGGEYAGGILGYANYTNTITGCQNTDRVTGGIAAGGIAGYSQTLITNCTVTSTNGKGISVVPVTATTVTYAGGIVGYNMGSSGISGCTFTGDAGTSSGTTVFISNEISTATTSCTGGIAGYCSAGTIQKCLVTGSGGGSGTVSLVAGNMANANYVGGIVGRMVVGTIQNVQVVDQRSATNGYFINSSAAASVGGIVGYNNASVMDVCVIDAHSNPTANLISGGDNSGGIVGNESGPIDIQRGLFIGKAPSNSSNDSYFPICGNTALDTSDTNNYYLDNGFYTSGTVSNGGTGQTTAQFETLDISTSSIWSLWERVSGYPYPKLKGFAAPTDWPGKP